MFLNHLNPYILKISAVAVKKNIINFGRQPALVKRCSNYRFINVNYFHSGCYLHSQRCEDVSKDSPDLATSTIVNHSEGESEKIAPSVDFTSNLNADDQRRVQLLRMEIEVYRHSGYTVPKNISDNKWEEILSMNSRFKRLKYLRYLFIREIRKEKEIEEKARNRIALEEFRKQRQSRDENVGSDGMIYSLNKNTLFLRILDTTMVSVYNSWMCQAIMFGEKLVIDLGYGDHMVKREVINCAKQVKELHVINRQNRQPFHLYFCNLSQEEEMKKQLESAIPNLYLDTCLVTVTENSYLDHFPREKLVYLTPHCNNDLKEFNHDDIYIIGGIVDKSIQKPLSLAKAKKEGLRMARLPLDSHLDWGNGNKSLTLDQMMKIMLDIKNIGNWDSAFKHIPRRKLRYDVDPEKKMFNRKLRNRNLYGSQLLH